jgi:hypothetical protein
LLIKPSVQNLFISQFFPFLQLKSAQTYTPELVRCSTDKL